MQVEWYGQSAFRLTAGEATVFIDPFQDMSGMAAARGMQWDYPAIEGVDADLVLVTHEHGDHNGVDAIGGSPTVLRSTAGRHESPIGEVVGIASEHDPKAGTERGPNTIFVFDFDGVRVAHFGDFGQSELRPEQADAIGRVDLLFIPVGGGPTIGADDAKAIAERLGARWIVPMHYRTPKIGFLETADEFLSQIPDVERFEEPRFDTASLPADKAPLAVVPTAP
jgi:L-ascorbate metabolism protein UlaG (beta-lactamase superfamily)